MDVNTRTFADNTYRIIKRLGTGGGGTVYLVWHKNLQEFVVIKKQGDTKQGDGSSAFPSACGTFCCTGAQRNEFEILENVKSRYLPQVYGFISEDNITFTVMEYIEGENFDSLLKRGFRFSQTEVFKWYAQLTSALKTLHRHNICHRDIKPANIMLKPSGDICLIDFNSALVYGKATKFISRSPGYASPEQYELFERLKNTGVAISYPGNNDNDCEFPGYDNKTQLSETTDFLPTLDPMNPVTYHTFPPPIQLCGGAPAMRTGRFFESRVDWKLSDIYSLGAAMYHILTGKRPHERASEVIRLFKLGNYEQNIVSIIEKSMRLEPSERFASAAELGIAIIGCLSPTASSAGVASSTGVASAAEAAASETSETSAGVSSAAEAAETATAAGAPSETSETAA